MELPKTRQELNLLIQSYLSIPPNDTELSKGCLLAHFNNLNRANNNQEFYKFLQGFYGERWSDSLCAPVRSAVQRIDEQINKWANSIYRETSSKRAASLLSQKYVLPVSRKRPAADPPVPDTPPATPDEPPTLNSFDYVTPKRSCLDCIDLRQESSSLRKELNNTKFDAAKLQRKVDVKFKKEPRVLGQANKRLKTQLEKQQETHEHEFYELQFEFLELQQDYLELDTKYNEKVNRVEQLVEDVDHLNNQIAKLSKQKAQIQRYHSAVKRETVRSAQLKAAKEEIKSLKEQLAYAENQLSDQDKENINTIDGNQFDAKTRKCIMYCLEKNVSQQNTSSIVKFIVREMTGKTITKLPKRTTVQNIARESSIVSNIQTGHIMSKSSNVTIAWDATVKKGTHLNEVHVITPYGPLVLDVSELPGGKAEDYKTHIQEALADIANQYSNCYEKDPDEVKKQIHDAITSTLTDRVPTNHATVRLLQEDFDQDLIELQCNTHPLDGLANKARSIGPELDKVDGVSGSCFGSDGTATNLIKGVSKMRHKMGVGHPESFKAYLTHKNMPLSTFPRYVGNRLHVIFHLAGVIVQHKDVLLEYFVNFCRCTNSLKSALISDFNNPIIMRTLQVLGLFGKVVTGPWMVQFYGNALGRKHLEMTPLMRKCVDYLDGLSSEPSLLVTGTKDCFGSTLPDDDLTLRALRNECNSDDLADTIKAFAAGFNEVLKRQLDKYLNGILSNPTPEMLVKTQNAPPHNMQAEGILGMVDAHMNKAPNARVDVISAKVKCAINNTVEWLCELPPGEQRQVLRSAARQRRTVAKQLRERKQRNIKIAKQRLYEMVLKKQKKETKQMEQKVEKFVASGKGTTIADIEKEFPLSSPEVLQVAVDLCHDPESMVSKGVTHLWYDKVKCNVDVYCGNVFEYFPAKGRKGAFFVMEYWFPGCPEDSHRSELKPVEFLADLLLGDLLFD